MPKFNSRGIAFEYPETWEFEESSGEGEWLISFSLPSGGVWNFSSHSPEHNAESITPQICETLREELGIDLEVEEVLREIGGHKFYGAEMHGELFEQIVVFQILTLQTQRATYTLFQQNEYEDSKKHKQQLEKMTLAAANSIVDLKSKVFEK